MERKFFVINQEVELLKRVSRVYLEENKIVFIFTDGTEIQACYEGELFAIEIFTNLLEQIGDAERTIIDVDKLGREYSVGYDYTA